MGRVSSGIALAPLLAMVAMLGCGSPKKQPPTRPRPPALQGVVEVDLRPLRRSALWPSVKGLPLQRLFLRASDSAAFARCAGAPPHAVADRAIFLLRPGEPAWDNGLVLLQGAFSASRLLGCLTTAAKPSATAPAELRVGSLPALGLTVGGRKVVVAAVSADRLGVALGLAHGDLPRAAEALAHSPLRSPGPAARGTVLRAAFAGLPLPVTLRRLLPASAVQAIRSLRDLRIRVARSGSQWRVDLDLRMGSAATALALAEALRRLASGATLPGPLARDRRLRAAAALVAGAKILVLGPLVKVTVSPTSAAVEGVARALLGLPAPDRGCDRLQARLGRCRNELALHGRPGLRFRHRTTISGADRKAVGKWLLPASNRVLASTSTLMARCRSQPGVRHVGAARRCLAQKGCEAFARCLRPQLSVGRLPPPPPLVARPDRMRDAIRAAVLMNHRRLRHCYERALLREGPGLRGGVTVRFSVAPDGGVSRLEVVKQDLRSPAAIDCLTRQVRSMRFPTSTSATVVTYPFVFRPAP